MARKVTPDGSGGPAVPKGAAGADDLAVLSPDAVLTIDGEEITVHEYRFFDGLAIRAQAAPFFDGLYQVLGQQGGPPPSFDDIEMMIAGHVELVKALVAMSVKRPVEWVAQLGEADGDALLMTWWQVNQNFFIRRVMRRALQERLSASPSDGPGFTTS